MEPITHIGFLHALGYAIGHSLWQVSLLWLVYRLFAHLFARTSRQRYGMAAGASLAGLLWFMATFALFMHAIYTQPLPTFTKQVTIDYSGGNLGTTALLYYHSAISLLKSLAPYLSSAYLAVVLVLALRMANGLRQVKTYRTKGLQKPPVDLKLFVQKYASHIGIKKPVALYVSQLVSSPLTIGFWKPLILVPLASINQLTPSQMEAVLLHELAHIKHFDYLVNLMLHTAEMLLFFNPFMRLLLHHAKQERENSCDDWVLQFRYCPKEYAYALLAIEQNRTQSLLALGATAQGKFQLLHRVKRMVSPERDAFNYRQQLGLLTLVTLLALAFTVVVPKPVQQQEVLVKTNTGTHMEPEFFTNGQNDFLATLQGIRAAMAERDAQKVQSLKEQQQAKKEFQNQQQAQLLTLAATIAAHQVPPIAEARVEAPVLPPIPNAYFNFAQDNNGYATAPYSFYWNNEMAPAFAEVGKSFYEALPQWQQLLENKIEGLNIEERKWNNLYYTWPAQKVTGQKATDNLRNQMIREKLQHASEVARQHTIITRQMDTMQRYSQKVLAGEALRAMALEQEALDKALAMLEKQVAAVELAELQFIKKPQALAPARPKNGKTQQKALPAEAEAGSRYRQALMPRENDKAYTFYSNPTRQDQLPGKKMMSGEDVTAIINLNGANGTPFAEGAITINVSTAAELAKAMEDLKLLGNNADKLLRDMEVELNREANESLRRVYQNSKRVEREIRVQQEANSRRAIVIQIEP